MIRFYEQPCSTPNATLKPFNPKPLDIKGAGYGHQRKHVTLLPPIKLPDCLTNPPAAPDPNETLPTVDPPPATVAPLPTVLKAILCAAPPANVSPLTNALIPKSRHTGSTLLLPAASMALAIPNAAC